MHPVQHSIISAIIATLFYFATASIEGAIACFIAGIIIDLDHIMDCLILHRTIDFRRITDNRNHSLYDDKITVTFHSLEIPIILTIFFTNTVTIAISTGFLTHMISDYFYYRHERQKSIFSLFFIYRMSKGFSAERLCS